VRAPANDTDELDNVMNALQGMNTSSGQNKSFAPNVSKAPFFSFFFFFLLSFSFLPVRPFLSFFFLFFFLRRKKKKSSIFNFSRAATACHLREKERARQHPELAQLGDEPDWR